MKKPFAYITAVWKGGEFTVIDQAAVYCRKVYEAGFTPICPVLYLPHFLRDSIPAEHKDGIDIGRELLRRSHVLIVCGDEVDESVKNDIGAARLLNHDLCRHLCRAGQCSFPGRGFAGFYLELRCLHSASVLQPV